jgi:hypothetical protein
MGTHDLLWGLLSLAKPITFRGVPVFLRLGEAFPETVALNLDKSFASFHVAIAFSAIDFGFGTNNEEAKRMDTRLKKRVGGVDLNSTGSKRARR